MGLGLELHVEKASFQDESGRVVEYNRYYVEVVNQYSGETEKQYLQAKDSAKYALNSYVKAYLKSLNK